MPAFILAVVGVRGAGDADGGDLGGPGLEELASTGVLRGGLVGSHPGRVRAGFDPGGMSGGQLAMRRVESLAMVLATFGPSAVGGGHREIACAGGRRIRPRRRSLDGWACDSLLMKSVNRVSRRDATSPGNPARPAFGTVRTHFSKGKLRAMSSTTPTLKATDLLAVKSRVSWGAISAGAMVALAIYFFLTLLGLAIGLEAGLAPVGGPAARASGRGSTRSSRCCSRCSSAAGPRAAWRWARPSSRRCSTG